MTEYLRTGNSTGAGATCSVGTKGSYKGVRLFACELLDLNKFLFLRRGSGPSSTGAGSSAPGSESGNKLYFDFDGFWD